MINWLKQTTQLAFIMSENITLLCFTIRKILIFYYTILISETSDMKQEQPIGWDLWFIQYWNVITWCGTIEVSEEMKMIYMIMDGDKILTYKSIEGSSEAFDDNVFVFSHQIYVLKHSWFAGSEIWRVLCESIKILAE